MRSAMCCSHTQTHVCYLVREHGIQGPAALFSGDALFVGGCGRWVGRPGSGRNPKLCLLTVFSGLLVCFHLCVCECA